MKLVLRFFAPTPVPTSFAFALGLLSTLNLQLSTFAQGSLTPPGVPAPTMKTLAQIEPRTPISTFGTNLTISGSYYLITNLFSGSSTGDAITIKTNIHDITIDLDGFSIVSTNPPGPDSPVGIRLSETTNIVIRNGQFSGFDRAVRCEGKFYGIVVDNVHAQYCHRAGVEADGIVGTPTATITVRNCVIDRVDATGEGGSSSADGIVLLNCTAMVDSCVVRDITPDAGGLGTCIHVITCTNTFINNNFLSHAAYGLDSSGTPGTFFYRNNLTSGCGTNFTGTGGVDRGGNF
ncbi:MAG: hypothetical protein QOJ40_2478 [Verrucomicrobiota bacterium]